MLGFLKGFLWEFFLVSFNADSNKCQLIPAVKIEGESHVSFEQSIRVNKATGEVEVSNRVSQSVHNRDHPEITPHPQHLQSTSQTQQKQPLAAGSELGTDTNDHTRVVPSKPVHLVSQSTPGLGPVPASR